MTGMLYDTLWYNIIYGKGKNVVLLFIGKIYIYCIPASATNGQNHITEKAKSTKWYSDETSDAESNRW